MTGKLKETTPMSSPNFRSNNHYVPKLYLKRWALDGARVATYPLLVPHQNCRVWNMEYLSSIPARRHLYTRLNAGLESDELEKWFDQEFESPVEDVFQKIERGSRLLPQDWKILARFLALQDVRTPARMSKILGQLSEDLPSLMTDCLEEAVAEAQAAHDEGRTMSIPESPNPSPFPMAVRTTIEPDAEIGKLGVETVVGRALWLHVIEHSLTYTINALMKHRWTILRPPAGMQWPTSDNPVIKLNYFSPEKYDFGGGWGSKGTEILFPLSPQHLLYTQIGLRPPANGSRVEPHLAQMFRRFIVEHAHRYVFSASEDIALSRLRKRTVDPAAVEHERRAWEEFHSRNVIAERELTQKLQ